MKQPLSKRRRISSNLHTPFASSEAFVTSLNPSRISACTSCHRIVGLKSSPAFLCASCNASTCPICLRTCTGASDPWWAGSLNLALDATTTPLAQSNVNSLSPRRRRSRDEDSDNISRAKDVDNGRSGCGQMVCRTCCFEHPQSGAIACLDCSKKQPTPQTDESNASIHGTRNTDHSLTCSLMASC